MADTLQILDSINSFPLQCQQVVWEIAQEQIPASCNLVDNIVISGMGGSALGGRIIANLERQILKVPIVVSTEYHLPNFVGPKTLVVISSYSGNTEETVQSLAEARARSAQIFVVAGGGKLSDLAITHNLPRYIFSPRHNPSQQPRMGLGYNILSIVCLLARCQLIHPLHQLSSLKEFLESELADPKPAFDLAQVLVSKIPILVSSEHLKGAAHAFKNQLNETGKSFSAIFDLPELNHHLMEGLLFPATNPATLHFILIDSDHYHPEVKRRYPLTAEVIRKNHIGVSQLHIKSPNRLFDTLSLVQSGALVSYHLSQFNNIDPGPVPWVDYFKDELSKG